MTHQCPDQLVFIDETSKDNRATIRKMAWSQFSDIIVNYLRKGKIIGTTAFVK
jgi:hypothetical protein